MTENIKKEIIFVPFIKLIFFALMRYDQLSKVIISLCLINLLYFCQLFIIQLIRKLNEFF